MFGVNVELAESKKRLYLLKARFKGKLLWNITYEFRYEPSSWVIRQSKLIRKGKHI